MKYLILIHLNEKELWALSETWMSALNAFDSPPALHRRVKMI